MNEAAKFAITMAHSIPENTILDQLYTLTRAYRADKSPENKRALTACVDMYHLKMCIETKGSLEAFLKYLDDKTVVINVSPSLN